MVRFDYRRALSWLFDAVARQLAQRGRNRFVFAAAHKRRERGQTLVEFAFALPLILVILLVLGDFGLALDRRQVAQHAVREGARAGAVGANVAEIRQMTADPLGVDPARIEVCYVNVGGAAYPGDAGDEVRVSGAFTYTFSAGGGELLSAFGVDPPEIAMTPSVQMRLERNVPGAAPC